MCPRTLRDRPAGRVLYSETGSSELLLILTLQGSHLHPHGDVAVLVPEVHVDDDGVHKKINIVRAVHELDKECLISQLG